MLLKFISLAVTRSLAAQVRHLSISPTFYAFPCNFGVSETGPLFAVAVTAVTLVKKDGIQEFGRRRLREGDVAVLVDYDVLLEQSTQENTRCKADRFAAPLDRASRLKESELQRTDSPLPCRNTFYSMVYQITTEEYPDDVNGYYFAKGFDGRVGGYRAIQITAGDDQGRIDPLPANAIAGPPPPPEPEPEPEPEPPPEPETVGYVEEEPVYTRRASSLVEFTLAADAKPPATATKKYQFYHRVVGGILIRQEFARKMDCEGAEISPHTNELYMDYCHPSEESRLACWDVDFCTKVKTDPDRHDLCAADNETLKTRCKAVPPRSGGKSVIGEEFLFLDLKDTICQVIEGAKEAESAGWINPATNTASMTIGKTHPHNNNNNNNNNTNTNTNGPRSLISADVLPFVAVLYNGELGVYTVVNFNFDFTSRGGRFSTHSQILTAEVPMRTTAWTILEFAVAVSLMSIVVGEMKELAVSMVYCTCLSKGGYFRDASNVLDWLVVLIFAIQAIYWIQLEFVWYQNDYEMLLPNYYIKEGNNSVTQDGFITIIRRMSEHAADANFVLRLGAINLILLLMRFIKQSALHPRLAFLVTTIKISFESLPAFALLFLSFMLAFSYAGTLLFGNRQDDFVGIWLGLIKMWNMLLGDFDTEMYMDGDDFDWFKVTWFVLYFIIGLYILMNMLLAIIMDAYAEADASDGHRCPSVSQDYHALAHLWWRSLQCGGNANRRSYAGLADLCDKHIILQIQDEYKEISDAEIRLLMDAIDVETERPGHMERQLLELRERLVEQELIDFYMAHEIDPEHMESQLRRWWSEFCPDCAESTEEWTQFCTHPHEGEYDPEVDRPSALLKLARIGLHLPFDDIPLGEVPLTVETVAEVLGVGEGEAQLFVEQIDEDNFADTDFEDDREPRMGDFAKLVNGLAGSSAQADRQKAQPGYLAEELEILRSVDGDCRRAIALLGVLRTKDEDQVSPEEGALLEDIEEKIKTVKTTLSLVIDQSKAENKKAITARTAADWVDGGHM